MNICNTENGITTKKLVECLREHLENDSLFVFSKDRQESVNISEMNSSSVCDTKELFIYGRKRGWLEEIDQLRAEEPIEKMAAARIFHQFLKNELGESDEIDWNRATELKDLYDCHTCVNHIAQVYVKGIIPARTDISCQQNEKSLCSLQNAFKKSDIKIFGVKDNLAVKEAYEMIERVFHKEKRLILESEIHISNTMDVESDQDKMLKEITVEEMKELLQNNPNAILIDVRTKDEYEKSHFTNAINIPLAKILNQPDIVGQDKKQSYLFYCDQGYQSKIAANCVLDHGYEAACSVIPAGRF